MQEGFFFTFTMTMNSKEILYILPKMHLSNCKSVFDSFILHHWMSIREFFALKINLLSPFSLLFGVHWTVTINKNAFRLEEPRKIDFFFAQWVCVEWCRDVGRTEPKKWKNRYIVSSCGLYKVFCAIETKKGMERRWQVEWSAYCKSCQH